MVWVVEAADGTRGPGPGGQVGIRHHGREEVCPRHNPEPAREQVISPLKSVSSAQSLTMLPFAKSLALGLFTVSQQDLTYSSNHVNLVSVSQLYPEFSSLFIYSGKSSPFSSVRPYANATSFKKPFQISHPSSRKGCQGHFPSAKCLFHVSHRPGASWDCIRVSSAWHSARHNLTC